MFSLGGFHPCAVIQHTLLESFLAQRVYSVHNIFDVTHLVGWNLTLCGVKNTNVSIVHAHISCISWPRFPVQLPVLWTCHSRSPLWSWTVKCDAHTIVDLVRIQTSCRIKSSLVGTVLKSTRDAWSCLAKITSSQGYHFQVILMLHGEVCLSGLGGQGSFSERVHEDSNETARWEVLCCTCSL